MDAEMLLSVALEKARPTGGVPRQQTGGAAGASASGPCNPGWRRSFRRPAAAGMPSPALAIAPVLLGSALFLYEGIVYNWLFLAQILPDVGKAHLIPLYAIIFNVPFVMAVWSYLRTRYSDPGYIPDQWRLFVQTTANLKPVASEQGWQPGLATFCKRCQESRPERAHHCSLCKKCVLRMDHHCPWTGNCVGFRNHKFFILLGFYTFFSGLIGFATTLLQLIFALTGWPWAGDDRGTSWRFNVSQWEGMVFMLFGVVAGGVIGLLGSMLSAHLPNAFKNLTSIEELYDNMENPFDFGNWFDNLSQVMGRFGLDWFFPVMPWRPFSDGVSYPRPNEALPPGLEPGSDSEGSSDEEAELERKEFKAEELWRIRYGLKGPGSLAVDSGPYQTPRH